MVKVISSYILREKTDSDMYREGKIQNRRGKILDISITYGGSSSDCLAFEASDLHKRLENGLLASGLVIFGDNAYLNSIFMATPYPNVAGMDKERSKDNYNFYHSQVSIGDSISI